MNSGTVTGRIEENHLSDSPYLLPKEKNRYRGACYEDLKVDVIVVNATTNRRARTYRRPFLALGTIEVRAIEIDVADPVDIVVFQDTFVYVAVSRVGIRNQAALPNKQDDRGESRI